MIIKEGKYRLLALRKSNAIHFSYYPIAVPRILKKLSVNKKNHYAY